MTSKFVARRQRVPWWHLTTVIVLTIALVIAAIGGRTVEAVIIGFVMIPSLLILGGPLFASMGERRRR